MLIHGGYLFPDLEYDAHQRTKAYDTAELIITSLVCSYSPGWSLRATMDYPAVKPPTAAAGNSSIEATLPRKRLDSDTRA